MPMVSIVTFETSMWLSLANSGHSPKVMPAGGAPSFLFSSCLGSGMPRLLRATIANGGLFYTLNIALSPRDGGWMRYFMRGVVLARAPVHGSPGHAGNGLEHARRLVEGHVQALGPEVALVLGEEKRRSQSLEAPVERELDAGLRRGRPCTRQRDRRREDMGGPNDPREVEEAHGCS